VRLLPVSKTHSASLVAEAVKAGCRQFGENRVGELLAKSSEVESAGFTGVEWILIGHLQRNKAALVASHVRELQSLDSLRLARVLQAELERTDSTLRVFIEVNSSGEDSKFGLLPDDVGEFSRALRVYDRLLPVGLMTVAHPDRVQAEQGFTVMKILQTRLRNRDGGGWHELSMGMSGDFESAIAHGSTCVRVGTAIFGLRA
jgi:pyridoxal phosphate enzyme (YggS family)